jgi:thiamine-phosphate pyrophosphorylase
MGAQGVKWRRTRSADEIWRWARTLRPARARGKPLPRLVFFTDPQRSPRPQDTLARLPRGAAVVFRAFGDPAAVAQGRRLVRIARRRGLVFLVGADARLAAHLGADGVHLPERAIAIAPQLRRQRPRWLVTCAAHSAPGLARARRGRVDAAFLSPVYPTASRPGQRGLGALRFARLVRSARLPVYALGGITAATARSLVRTGAAGLAAVESLTR